MIFATALAAADGLLPLTRAEQFYGESGLKCCVRKCLNIDFLTPSLNQQFASSSQPSWMCFRNSGDLLRIKKSEFTTYSGFECFALDCGSDQLK